MPVRVTRVPPRVTPLLGLTARFAGVVSVTTNAPERTDASPPRVTVRFLGPRNAEADTEKSILALVDATEEIRPPKVGAPRISPALEVENTTPAVMSSPPIVTTPVLPRDTRMPKPGLVRFRTVVP